MKLSKILLSFFVLTFGFATLASHVYADSTNTITWSNKADIPTARYGLRAVTSNGQIYAIGGNSNSTIVNTVEMYDPSTDSWVTKTGMLNAREDMGVAVSNGKIYVMGGQNSSGNLSSVEMYDPTTDSWTAKASMPEARSAFSAVTGNDGKIYAIGGVTTSSPIANTLVVYDPATDTWTTKTSMSNARYLLATALDSNGNIYAIGGTTSSGPTNIVEMYNPTTDTWSTKASLPNNQTELQATLGNNGYIYAIGGDDSRNYESGIVNEYNPQTNTWKTLNTLMSYPRADFGLAVGSDNNLYPIGGVGSSGSEINNVEQGVLDNAPIITTIPNSTVNQGSTYSLNGSFSDSDSSSWTASVNYGDGTGTQPLTLSGTNFSLSHTYTSVGTYNLTVTISDNQGATSTSTATITVQRQLVALNPSNIWVGLASNKDSGIKFDLKAEVYANGVLVSSGQVNSVSGGSSSQFSGAVQDAIPFNSFTAVNFPSTSTLSIKLYARNACTGSTKTSGSARLWYNSSSANSRFGATVGTSTSSYYLGSSSTLLTSTGSSISSTDVIVGAQCGSFVQFGTWSITF